MGPNPVVLTAAPVLRGSRLIKEERRKSGATELPLLLFPTQKDTPTSLCAMKETSRLNLHGQKFA